MSFFSLRHTVVALTCGLSFSVSAQNTSVKQLDNIVVTASRTAQLQSEVIGDVSVIDSAQIERAGQSSIADLLSRQHGIQIADYGGPQTATSVFMRGTNSTHTLVLLDGVRINSAVQGSINFNAIDPSQIERIEIVRGAGSSLYGAEAIGGVINIITKKGNPDQPPALWANLGLGSHDTFKSSAGISGAANGFNYGLSGSFADSDGFDATNPRAGYSANSDTDGYHSHSLNANLGYAFNTKHRIDAQLFSGFMNGDYDEGGSPWLRDYAVTRQQALHLRSTHQLHANWKSTLSASETRESVESHTPNGFDQYAYYQSKLRTYAWQNDFQLSPQQSLSLLLEHAKENIVNSVSLPVTRRSTNSAALIYRFQNEHHNLQASVRHDHQSEHVKRTTGGLGYDFALSPSWSIGASASTGFKVPNFTELYHPLWGGNPELKPETSTNIEARTAYHYDQGHIQLSVYQNRIKNMIASDANWRMANINRVGIKGLSLSAQHQFENLQLWGSIDLTNPRNRESGERLQRRAAQHYKLGANYRYQQALFGAEYAWTSKRSDFDNLSYGTTNNGSYHLLNLTAEYPLSSSLTAQLRWNNVFNKQFELANGYNTPGSTVFINLACRL